MISHAIAFLAGIAVAVPLFHVSATSVKGAISSLKTDIAEILAHLRALRANKP